jgi:transcriptional regulator with XRE-family HTH domain
MLPPIAIAIKRLGTDLKTARIKRHLRRADVAEASGLSASTIQRLESGDPGVSLGTLCAVLHVIGELGRIQSLIDVADDKTGLVIDKTRLPKRVRRKPATASGAEF